MPIWSELERMVMFDTYYHNLPELIEKDITYEDYEHMFYKDLTSRMRYVYSFWNDRLSSEYKHG
jgi:hypothetical protein